MVEINEDKSFDCGKNRNIYKLLESYLVNCGNDLCDMLFYTRLSYRPI